MDNNETNDKKISLEQAREILDLDKKVGSINELSKGGQAKDAYELVTEMVETGTNFSKFQSNMLGWAIYRFLKEELEKPTASFTVVRNALATYCRIPNTERPSMLHSFILRLAVETERAFTKEFKFTGFMKVWGLDNFREEDWVDFKGEKNTVPSLVKSVIAKYSAELKDDEIPASAIDPNYETFLDKAIGKYPSWPLGMLYKSRLLSAYGHDDEALDMLKRLAATSGQAYVFKEIADLSTDIDTKIAGYCKYVAVQERARQSELIGKARIHLARLLIEKGRHAEAMTELSNYYKVTADRHWRIANDYYMVKSQIPNGVQPLPSNAALYREMETVIDHVIYGDVEETPILVTFINKEHRSLNFVTSDRKEGFLMKAPKGMVVNKCYMVKFAQFNRHKPSKIISFRQASPEESADAKLTINITGQLTTTPSGVGFVKSGDISIFVPKRLADGKEYGTTFTVDAVLNYNRKRQTWGYTAISLTPSE